jgi:mannitol 2-dehydrogenase
MTTVTLYPYTKSDIHPGIAHVGVGGFHRAHQAVYLDRLAARGERDWGICGVGLMPGDRRMRDALASQGLDYMVVERKAGEAPTAYTVGSIVGFLLSEDNPQTLIEHLASPNTKIVSLTITEGGYTLVGKDGSLLLAVSADLDPETEPRTVFRYVMEALALRRHRGIAPFTVMSCDNIQSNGLVAREAFCGFADMFDSKMGTWMRQEVAFPSSMVDRITPVTTDADRGWVAEEFGVQDAWPVICEPYLQWVLEDRFTSTRPTLEDVGVQVVDDVAPFERMKLRLLNGGHQVLGQFGALLGKEFVHDAIHEPALAAFMGRYHSEALPTVGPVPDSNLADYCDSVAHRFANSAIADTVARICQDASDRIPKFVLPVVHDQLVTGAPIQATAGVVAAWAANVERAYLAGGAAAIDDRQRDLLATMASRSLADPTGFLQERSIFADLVSHPEFVDPYVAMLTAIRNGGAALALQEVCETGAFA